jgi:hypothetical protein
MEDHAIRTAICGCPVLATEDRAERCIERLQGGSRRVEAGTGSLRPALGGAVRSAGGRLLTDRLHAAARQGRYADAPPRFSPGDSAILEFETTVGKYVNGVDIIRASRKPQLHPDER